MKSKIPQDIKIYIEGFGGKQDRKKLRKYYHAKPEVLTRVI
ncbi:hypothetical protein AVV30_gp038 [Vibrio phage phi 1]|uniref:Uncharacterized protein n=1 Tax=Vibrio phage phi 1 TaxID=1589297 RepID=A0A0B5GYE3_9CAUD|nr:hypothetical protein AVV30_gp038 [Vibrio phage phi 1]AJF40696.1 hypothetical protein SBVP1_0038 [Vibrio phage phi 1]